MKLMVFGPGKVILNPVEAIVLWKKHLVVVHLFTENGKWKIC